MGKKGRGVEGRERELSRKNWQGKAKGGVGLNSAGKVGKVMAGYQFGDGQIRWATSW